MYRETNKQREEIDAGEDTPDGPLYTGEGLKLDWHPRPPKIPPEALPGFEGLGPAEGDPDHIFRGNE